MDDSEIIRVPPVVEAIEHDTQRIGFTMHLPAEQAHYSASWRRRNRLADFWSLVQEQASARHGCWREWIRPRSWIPLIGIPECRILRSGILMMIAASCSMLRTVSNFLRNPYDLIFADSWAGKFNHLDEALSLLRVGGIYFIDDLLPQPNWPEDHAGKLAALVNNLESRKEFEITKLDWASGLLILVRKAL